ncbi:MAG: hypothetical protein WC614_13515 [bacterium]
MKKYISCLVLFLLFTNAIADSFTILSPNGGENWVRGNPYPITWASEGVTGNIKIELYRGGAFKFIIASNAANTGTYSWWVPGGDDTRDRL